MSFTSNQRMTAGKPVKADADMDVLIANAEYINTNYVFGAASVNQLSQTLASGVLTTVSFDTTVLFDTHSWFSSGSPTKLTVPSGFTFAQFDIYFQNNTIEGMVNFNFQMLKNNAAVVGGMEVFVDRIREGSFSSAMLSVSAGDFFTFKAQQNEVSSKTIRVIVSVRGYK